MADVRKLAELKAKQKELKAQAKALQPEIDDIEQLIISEWLTEQKSSEKLSGIGTVYLHTSQIPQIVDDEAFEKWMKERGHWETIRMLSPGKFKSFYSSLEKEEGAELPDGVETFDRTSIRIRK